MTLSNQMTPHILVTCIELKEVILNHDLLYLVLSGCIIFKLHNTLITNSNLLKG